MDVSLCYDCAVCDLDLACGTNELEAGGACGVAALTDGGNDTECACIGEGKLNLVCGTNGTENANCKVALGANQSDLFVAGCKLTGLAQHLLYGQLRAFAVECRNCLCSQVDMSCGSFNENLHQNYLTLIFTCWKLVRQKAAFHTLIV